MTDQQIRERCAAFLRDPRHEFEVNDIDGNPYKFQVAALESLCREMLAAGLERAAVEAERRQGLILAPGHHMEFESGFRCACYDLQYWHRAEAQRVKEGK